MTKVFLPQPLYTYQQAMLRAVEQVRREGTIAGLQPCSVQMPFRIPSDAVSSQPCLAGLLQPPRIEMLPDIEKRNGQIDGLLQFWTWGEFGPLNVSVNLRDAQGNLIESDYALPNPEFMNHWAYIIELEAADFTSLTVQGIVTDRLGGMSMQTVTLLLEA